MFGFLRALLAVGLIVGFESSCQKRRVAIPAPTPRASAPSEQSRPVPATPAPASDSPPPPNAPAKDEPRFQINRPPQPAETQQQAPPQRSSRPSEPNGTGQPARPPVNQPPNQSPRLGDVLTPEQERQYNAAIDQSLTRAQNSLGTLTNRQLTKEQQAVVAQIQSFVQQAQTARKSNLPAARSLAERADVLARDLAGSLR
jgi:hypothetical protein